MLFGAPAWSLGDLVTLKRLGFDFAEILLFGSTIRRLWWESGIRSDALGFFLIAHGPLKDHASADVDYLWNAYLPALKATVDTCRRIRVRLLTIHFSVNGRIVAGLALAEKIRALNELVDYGRRARVVVSLENVTERAEDLETVFGAVPGLGITLDVGHAELVAPGTSSEIIRRLGSGIQHVHLHDNQGGGPTEDHHLPIGEGNIDFLGILDDLFRSGYDGTFTLEIAAQHLECSLERIRSLAQLIAGTDQ